MDTTADVRCGRCAQVLGPQSVWLGVVPYHHGCVPSPPPTTAGSAETCECCVGGSHRAGTDCRRCDCTAAQFVPRQPPATPAPFVLEGPYGALSNTTQRPAPVNPLTEFYADLAAKQVSNDLPALTFDMYELHGNAPAPVDEGGLREACIAEIRMEHEGCRGGESCDVCFLLAEVQRLKDDRDEAVAKSAIDERQCDEMTSRCGELAEEVQRLKAERDEWEARAVSLFWTDGDTKASAVQLARDAHIAMKAENARLREQLAQREKATQAVDALILWATVPNTLHAGCKQCRVCGYHDHHGALGGVTNIGHSESCPVPSLPAKK